MTLDSLQFPRGELQLDDWVLCRIYNKNGGTHSKKAGVTSFTQMQRPKLETLPVKAPQHSQMQAAVSENICFDPSDSFPKPSNCSDNILSPSSDFTSYEGNAHQSQAIESTAPVSRPLELEQMSSMFQDTYLQDIFTYLQKPI